MVVFSEQKLQSAVYLAEKAGQEKEKELKQIASLNFY